MDAAAAAPMGVRTLEHVPYSVFQAQNPQFKGDLYDSRNFDPNNTGDPTKFLYDPHMIEDDRPQLPLPSGGAQVGPDSPDNVLALPDMVPLVGGSGGYLQPYIDTTEIPGRNLMRFSTAIGNQGAGPAILTSSNSAVDPQGRQIVTQKLYNYNSSTNQFTFREDREAGRFVWHNGHGHFHFEGYAEYRLLHNVGGQPGGQVMRSDGSQAIGDKVGFCLINVSNSFTIPGTGVNSNTLPGYNAPGQPSTSCGFTQGIHVGKADVYSSIYDGQWIDVTGVPNGNYFLEVTLDASNTILESNENNNTVYVAYTLNAAPPVGGIQPDRFEPNNTFAQAVDLGELGVETQPGLTIHTSNESDFFKFRAASTGTYSVRLNVGDRDVNLYVYDSAQNLLGQSASPTNGPMTETVTTSFVKGQVYYVEARGFGTAQGTSGVSSNYSLTVDVKPTVDLTATTPTASAANGPGVVNIARNGPTSSPLTVNLAISGTAVPNVDYVPLPSSLTIGNESSSEDLEVTIRSNAVITTNKTVIVTAQTNTNYVIGNGSVTITLLENVKPVMQNATFGYADTPQTLAFRFSEDVSASLAISDFVIARRRDGAPIIPASLTWNPGTNTAVLGFAGILDDGSYDYSINAASVTDAAGNPLASSVAGAFRYLRGDANGDGVIDFDDYAVIDTGFLNGLSGYANGDFNRDGVIDFDDYAIIDFNFLNQGTII
jgi:hypothetical protein